MKIQYSPEAVDRLKDIKRIWGINTYKNIRESIGGLSTVPQKGALVENYIEIPNPYSKYNLIKIAEESKIYLSDKYLFIR